MLSCIVFNEEQSNGNKSQHGSSNCSIEIELLSTYKNLHTLWEGVMPFSITQWRGWVKIAFFVGEGGTFS